MDLGRVGIWTFILDNHPTSTVIEVARELESMGWPTLWRPESSGRDALISATVLLDATEKLQVATGIAQIYARHPVTTAAAQKTIHEAHEGRFLLGLGVAHHTSVEGVRGLDYSTPYSDMVEYLKAMESAPYGAVTAESRPLTVLAALGPKMLRLSRDAADGAHPYLTPPSHTAMAREILGDGPILAPEVMVAIDDDVERARDVARRVIERYLRLPNYRNNLLRGGFTETDLDTMSDRVVDGIVACGPIGKTLERVAEHHEAGADHVCIQVLARDDDLAETRRRWAELAEAYSL